MELEEVTKAITAGEFDGRLDQLVKAAVGRVKEGAVEMVWQARFDGDEWDAKSVTLGELIWAQRYAGAVGRDGSYRRELTPTVTQGDAVAILVARLIKRKRLTQDDAVERVEGLGAGDLAEIFDEYEVVRQGKDDAGSEAANNS